MGIVQLISPPLIAYQNDIFGMIPSPPIGLASIAAFSRKNGFDVDLIDSFGADPFRTKKYGRQFVIIGLDIEDILSNIKLNADVIGISVHSAMVAKFCMDLGLKIKENYHKPVVVGGPHISLNYEQFINAGIDYAVIGEGELPFIQLVTDLQGGGSGKNIPGVATLGQSRIQNGDVLEMDDLPMPAWDLIPLKNYWKTKINHSPFQGRFIPMISSRGCPFKCSFCTTPLTSRGRWRAYSADRVLKEIKFLHDVHGVVDIAIQDDNFSANPKRTKEICELIVKEGLNLRLSLPSGVRLETLSEDLLNAMRKAGLTYLSLSPESGSKRIRQLMRKTLDENKFYRIQKHCKLLNIKIGICFIIGNPEERMADILQTAKMIAKTIYLGADDISIFIFSPLPGAPLAKTFEKKFPKDLLGLCWTPKWREDYKKWAVVRYLLYAEYAILKIIFQPFSIWQHIKNVVKREFETKGEMGIARLLANRFSSAKGSWPVKPR